MSEPASKIDRVKSRSVRERGCATVSEGEAGRERGGGLWKAKEMYGSDCYGIIRRGRTCD